jgi:hypothetical protein
MESEGSYMVKPSGFPGNNDDMESTGSYMVKGGGDNDASKKFDDM